MWHACLSASGIGIDRDQETLSTLAPRASGKQSRLRANAAATPPGAFTLVLFAFASLVCATGAMTSPVALGAQIWYVDIDAAPGGDGLSWASAFNDLHAGLAAAIMPGDEIWVAEGVYRPAEPGGNRGASFSLAAGAALYGGFRGDESQRDQRNWLDHPTTLSGDLNGDDLPRFTNTEENTVQVVSAATDPDSPTPTRLDGVTIANGRGSYGGSGLGQWGTGSIELANIVFADCWGNERGGAVHLRDAHATITNCIFERNRCGLFSGGVRWSAYGGGLAAERMTFLEITGSQFTSNLALTAENSNGGGAYLSECAELSISASIFVDNYSAEDGAALSIQDCTDPLIDDCTFKDNRARYAGGAIDCVHSTLSITNSVFDHNEVFYHLPSKGGAICLYVVDPNEGVSSINNCVFRNNAATTKTLWESEGGGAIWARANIRIEDCLFEGNNTDRDGGALVLRRDATILRTRFIGNHANWDGAVFRMSSLSAVIEDCIFEANTGGGTVLEYSAGYDDGMMEVRRCIFRENIGERGIFRADENAVFMDCTFASNVGSSIFTRSDGDLYFEACRFEANRIDLGDYAAVIHLDSPGPTSRTTTFVNCAFVDNIGKERGLMYVDTDCFATLVNCLITGNRVANGGEPAIGRFARESWQATNCVLWNNGVDPLQGPVTVDFCLADTLYPGAGNIVADPLFRKASTGDYHPLQGSPLIDAADSGALPPEVTRDLDGNPRFVDDAGTIDSGAGMPSYLDIGCYEFQGTTSALHVEFDREILRARRPVRVIARGGEPDTSIYLFGSLTGTGETYVAGLNLTLDLDQAQPIGSRHRETNADGRCVWSFMIPDVPWPTPIWIQAAQPGNPGVVKPDTIWVQ